MGIVYIPKFGELKLQNGRRCYHSNKWIDFAYNDAVLSAFNFVCDYMGENKERLPQRLTYNINNAVKLSTKLFKKSKLNLTGNFNWSKNSTASHIYHYKHRISLDELAWINTLKLENNQITTPLHAFNLAVMNYIEIFIQTFNKQRNDNIFPQVEEVYDIACKEGNKRLIKTLKPFVRDDSYILLGFYGIGEDSTRDYKLNKQELIPLEESDVILLEN